LQRLAHSANVKTTTLYPSGLALQQFRYKDHCSVASLAGLRLVDQKPPHRLLSMRVPLDAHSLVKA